MRQSEPSFFLMKNTGAPIGDLDGWMWPFTRFSWRKSSSSFCSAGNRGNIQEEGSSVPGVRSMAWSHAFHGGSLSKASLEKTSLKSWYWASTMSSRGQLPSAFCASWASRCNGVSVRAHLRPGTYHILVLTELQQICRTGAQGDGSLLNALSRKCYMHMLQYVHRGTLP